MEKTIVLKNGNEIVINKTSLNFKEAISINKSYNNDKTFSKVLTFYKADSSYIEGWTFDNYQGNSIPFKITNLSPLFGNMKKLLNGNDKLIIKDKQEKGKYLSIVDQESSIDFVLTNESLKQIETTNIFIKPSISEKEKLNEFIEMTYNELVIYKKEKK